MKYAARQKVSKSKIPARDLLDLGDAELLTQCEIDVYRASGPGGQKRSKTSSAIRLRHKPTGLMVIAEESRSQHENRQRALRRLRKTIALNQRNQIKVESPHPEFYAAALARDSSLRVNYRHRDYCHIVQYVLDVMFACRAGVADTAAALDITTGHLIRFLKNDRKLWDHANRLRGDFDHQPLR
ncbi:MAG: peptide chain release factor-like protein [Planctomycetota bacterium]|nr:MAG: peptide chain release factor-like protein [Planctomycetota bacterium]